MKVKMVVVAEQHKHGGPGLFRCIIEGTEIQHRNGDFYDAARRLAKEHDWQDMMVAIDETDGIECLFKNFDKEEIVEGVVTTEDEGF